VNTGQLISACTYGHRLALNPRLFSGDSAIAYSGEGGHFLLPGYQVRDGETIEMVVAAGPRHDLHHGDRVEQEAVDPLGGPVDRKALAYRDLGTLFKNTNNLNQR
jgi:hypothetical protein